MLVHSKRAGAGNDLGWQGLGLLLQVDGHNTGHVGGSHAGARSPGVRCVVHLQPMLDLSARHAHRTRVKAQEAVKESSPWKHAEGSGSRAPLLISVQSPAQVPCSLL